MKTRRADDALQSPTKAGKDSVMASTILVSLLVIVPLVLLAWDLGRPRRRRAAADTKPPTDKRIRPSAS